MASTNPGSAKTSIKAANRAEATVLHKTRLLRLAEGDVSWVKAKRIAGHCELHAREWDIMAAGLSDRLWEVAEIVALVEAAEAPAKKRGPYKKAEALT